MRVLHVTDTFLPKIGGAEIAIDQLVRAMNAAGESCAVLAQRPSEFDREIQTPYPLSRFSNPRSATWAGLWIERHIARLERRDGKFDAVIGHHAFPPGYACVRHARRRGIPSIIYPRGGDIYEVSRFRKKPLAWRKLRWALGHASRVVCASAAMETVVREILGKKGGAAADERVVRIPNGVNLDELQADASTSRFAGDSRFVGPFVLALGRAIKRKGFHLLIEAAAAPAGQDEWKLVIAGEGRELEALKAQAAPLGERIIFTGLVEGADKRWLLQNCRFMAAPSLEESFGNVALEAMACGKPVIASRASGFAEIVTDGENGRLLPVGDVAALAAAIREYCAVDVRSACAAASRTAEKFSWGHIARTYSDLLQQLVPPQAGG